MSESETRDPSIRVMLMPKDTNGHGTIFGGAILSHLDIAGAVEARKHTTHRVVTAAIDKVEFISPVQVGDLVSYYTTTTRLGGSSVTVTIDVEAQRADGSGTAKVTSASAGYVAVDRSGKVVKLV
ncbi:MAG: hotdog domain-containing protein [Candidatus Latescibacterota bacterium]|nr:hotdog domain-containing protein [Candidatus Latescibacterota bacterium]